MKTLRQLSILLMIALVMPAGAADKPLLKVPLGDAPVRGSADAPVTMVEFIDFQ